MSQVAAFHQVTVKRGNTDILGPISLTFSEGERWVILGPNGAGKSTLLKVLATEVFPTSGQVELLNQQLGRVDIFDLRTRIGLCASLRHEQIPDQEKVKDVVLTAAYAVLGRWQEDYDLWDESRATALLNTFGVRALADREYGTLSDGEKKRVQIARALMSDPEILLLDEPTSALDLAGREDLLARFANFVNDNRAPVTIMVTHHIEEIPEGTTHALLLKEGKLAVAGPVAEVITSENISKVFGLSLKVEHSNGRFFGRSA